MKQLATLILSVVILGLMVSTAQAQNLHTDKTPPFQKSDTELDVHSELMELMAEDAQVRSLMKQLMKENIEDMPMLADAAQCVQVCSYESDNSDGHMGEVKSDSSTDMVLAESDNYNIKKMIKECPMMGDDEDESDDHDDHH